MNVFVRRSRAGVKTHALAWGFGLLLGLVCQNQTTARSQPRQPPEAAEAHIESYEPSIHPGPYDEAGEGVVVVQVQLRSDGTVEDARARSGPRAVIGAALANVKKMKINSGGRATAVILYDYKLADVCYGTNYWIRRDVVTVVGCVANY